MSSNQNGSSKTDTLVKVVLVFFVSLLSFSVGTFVGKQVSDSDHRRLALEGDGGRAVASVDGHDEHAEEGGISEKEVASLTEEFVNKETVAHGEAESSEHGAEAAAPEHGAAAKAETEHGDAHGKSAAVDATGYKSFDRSKKATAKTDAHAVAETEKATEHTEAKADEHKVTGHVASKAAALHTKGHEVADKLAAGVAPSDGAKEVRKPASTLPSVASSAIGKYTIQVASYSGEEEAKKRAADLKAKGWAAFYIPATVDSHTWYRVSIGLYSTLKSANEFRTQYMKEANSKDAIVQKIVQ